MRLWGGRFGDGPDARMADFTRSIEVDAELALDDIAGSIAHVRGLGRAGLLTDGGGRGRSSAASSALRDDVVAGRDRLGSGARGRPHEPRDAAHGAGRARSAASSTPGGRGTTRSPRTCGCGRGAPSGASTPGSSTSSGRWSTSRTARATPSCPARRTSSRPSRCCSRTTCSPTSRCSSATAAASRDARRRLNVSPLGAGALAGAGYPLDRETTAAELGFDGVTANSLDAVVGPRLRGRGARRPWRSRWSTSRGSRRRSRGGRTRASGSCASPTRSRPAPR